MLYKNKPHKISQASPINLLSKFNQEILPKKQETLVPNSFLTHKERKLPSSPYLNLNRKYNYKNSNTLMLTLTNRNMLNTQLSNCLNCPNCSRKYNINGIETNEANKGKTKLAQIKKEMLLMFTPGTEPKKSKNKQQIQSRNSRGRMSVGVDRIRNQSKDNSKSKTFQLVEIKRLIEQLYNSNENGNDNANMNKLFNNKKPIIIKHHLTALTKENHHKRIQSEINSKDIEEFSKQFDTILTTTKTRNKPIENYTKESNKVKRTFNTVSSYTNTFIPF